MKKIKGIVGRKRVKRTYKRDELIEICEDAIVSENKWDDRDSQGSIKNIGLVWALLSCGCEFEMVKHSTNCKTDEEIIWIYISSKGFDFFEGGQLERDIYYLPTRKRLDDNSGGDWY